MVCANFFVKALIITKKESRVQMFQRLYYSVVGGFYVAMIVLALVSETRIDCSTTMFSKIAYSNSIGYHWFILDIVDFMQSILICISASIIVKHVKALIKQEARLSSGINHLNLTNPHNNTVSQDSQKNCLRQQTVSLAGSYLLFATTDIIMMAIGNSVIGQNEDFECDNSDEVVRKLPNILLTM